MSEMVERVARVMFYDLRGSGYDEVGENVREVYRRMARAAIKEMRDPLPEMIGAFWRQKNFGTQEIGQTGSETHDYAAWRAAVDAALSEND